MRQAEKKRYMDDAEYLALFFPDNKENDSHNDGIDEKHEFLVRAAAYTTFRLEKARFIENYNGTEQDPAHIQTAFEAHYPVEKIDGMMSRYRDYVREICEGFAIRMISDGVRENTIYSSIKGSMDVLMSEFRRMRNPWRLFKTSLLVSLASGITLTLLGILVITILTAVYGEKPWAQVLKAMLNEDTRVVLESTAEEGVQTFRIESPNG